MLKTMTGVVLSAALALAAANAVAADAGKGKRVFNKCRACHKLEAGKKGVGPDLAGIVGRDIAAADGYGYSDGMKAFAGEHGSWTPEALTMFLSDPKGTVSGTKMSFAGLKKAEDIENLIAYFESLN